MTAEITEQMTGLKKAAILLVMFGPEKAAEVLSRCNFAAPEMESLASEMARVEKVDEKVRAALSEEIKKMADSSGAKSGGVHFAADVISRIYGPEKAAAMMEKLGPKVTAKPFASLANVGIPQLLEAIREEQPQAIAILLRYLPRQKAGEFLAGLPDEARIEVVMRLVRAKEPHREALTRMEDAIKQKVRNFTGADPQAVESKSGVGGARTLVEILNQADITVENMVLAGLAQKDPELGKQVRDSMFVFEDIPTLDPRQLQVVLREIESKDLGVALKGASEEISNAVFENLSENATAALKEDLEALGRVRKKDVNAARQKILTTIRQMMEEGKISLRQEETAGEAGEEGEEGEAGEEEKAGEAVAAG
jgi:flagellar motor switch protein FliG